MVEPAAAGYFNPRIISNVMLIQVLFNIFPKKSSHTRLSHYKHIINSQHGLHENVKSLPNIGLRSLNKEPTPIIFYTKPI